VSTNRFDDKAATWDDDPAKVQRAEVVASAIRATVPLDHSMRMLEYGAGTGLVAQALRDSVGPVTMADSSTGMREVMRAKIDAGAITDARVWDLDLASDPVPDERFDLIVTVMTLHHIQDLAPVLAGFADLLVDGGPLCVVDLEKEDGSFHGADFDGHQGFRRSTLAADLTAAGFTDVAFQDCDAVVRDGVRYPLFLATCVRTGQGWAGAGGASGISKSSSSG
jgi:predicted TPR repeat methyltransferase